MFILVGRQLTDSKKVNLQTQQEVALATRYFNEHFSQNISIAEYANSLHMSTCWFIRSFRQYNGITPMQYILDIRIANAQSLLLTTSYNVTEIAEIVGYDNPLYFSRLFKKQTGMSPSEYRRQQSVL